MDCVMASPGGAVRLVVLALMLTASCVGSVDGQVDDEDVPWLLSSYFIQLDEDDDAPAC
jgi:hypothetical protein